MTRPLIATAHEPTRDALLRLAAVAGVDAAGVTDAAAARRSWREPSLLVVGADVARSLSSAAPPRRPGVVLLGDDLDDASIWQRAVELGAEHVAFLPDAEPWLIQRLGAGGAGSRDVEVVGVLGGRGGAGASTLAAALALCAARLGHRSMLVDADPVGGGVDLLLGAEDARGPRWPDVARAVGRGIGSGLREVLPAVQRTPFLSWDRADPAALTPGTVSAVLAAARADSDLVVIDLPRRLDDEAVEVLSSAAHVLVVVPAEVRAVAAAARLAAAVSPYVADLAAVVRRPQSGGMAPAFVAESLGLPMAAAYRSERGVMLDAERGLPPSVSGRGHLARACTSLVRRLVAGRGELRAAA